MVTKVALYIRVSTLLQAEEGFSIQGQKHNLQQYCNVNNLQVYKVYIDKGITGTSIQEREGLRKLLQDAKEGCFDEVITWKVSRLARNAQDLLYVLKVLNDHQVTLRSISENLATDSLNGLFTVQMMGAVAELERNVIVENVKQGINQRLSQGWYSGAAILGYDNIPKKVCKQQNLQTNLRVNNEEAKVVKLIFDMYEQGYGYKAIVQHLNNEGIKSKQDKLFCVNSVRRILKRSLYTGKIEVKLNGKKTVVTGNHEPIITMEQWECVQSKASLRQKEQTKEQGYKFTLSKLLKCPICGSSLVGKVITAKRKNGNIKQNYYYICSLYQNKGSKACTSKMIPAPVIEEEVYRYLENFVGNAKVLSDVHNRLNTYDKAFQDNMKKYNSLKKQEDMLSKRQKLLMIQFESDEISKDVFVIKINNTKQQLVRVIKILFHYFHILHDPVKTHIPVEDVRKVFSNLTNILRQRGAHEVRAVLQSIISKVVVDEQKQLKDIELKIDTQRILLHVPEEDKQCKIN